VLKVCGDFAVECYLATGDDEFVGMAEGFFKECATFDKRAESFIDLASVFQVSGKADMSIAVLRRVLKAFQAHLALWTNLGISFALVEKWAFARHCLCVAAKIAGEVELGIIYARLAVVASAQSETPLAKQLVDAARQKNPDVHDVWELLGSLGEVDPLNAARIAFELGAGPETIKSLAKLELLADQTGRALHYALLAGDQEAIAASFEAQGQYEVALQHTEADEAHDKLNDLVSGSVRPDDHFGAIVDAVEYCQRNDVTRAVAKLGEARQEFPEFAQQIELIAAKIDPTQVGNSPESYFVARAKTVGRLRAAEEAVTKFRKAHFSMTIFVVEWVKARDRVDFQILEDMARRLFKEFPGEESLKLLLGALVRRGAGVEKIFTIAQRLAVMRPANYKVLRSVIGKLRQSIGPKT
jgi:tetratricopeptide (TPR) repeat protein